MKSQIEARILSKEEYEKWDELVSDSVQGTVFHRSDWIETCSQALNKEYMLIGCFNQGQLVGGCSIYVNKVGPLRTASSVVQMTPYGGLLLRSPSTVKVKKKEQLYRDLTNSLFELFRTQNFSHIRLANSPGLEDIRPFIWRGWQERVCYTYYLNLESKIEETISKDVRWDVNKAEKNGIKAQRLDDITKDDILRLYELFSMTYSRQRMKPPVSLDFMRKNIELIYEKDIGKVWFSRMPDGEVAAAEIIVFDNKRAYRWSAASHPDLRKTGAVSFLLYSIFCDIKGTYKEINLMAANTPILAKFVSNFNPTLVPYYMIEKSNLIYKTIETAHRAFKSLSR